MPYETSFTNGNGVVAQPPWQDPAAINTLSPNGTPPKSRITDPNQAQQIVAYLIEANRERLRKESQQKGMFDGNAPYNAFKMRAAGRAWEANFSTLEGKARKASAKVPYYDLFAGSRTYCEMETDFGDDSDRIRWSRIMVEEVDLTCKQWMGFSFNMWTMLDDFIGYGKGFLFFQDPFTWRFRKVAQSRVLVHDGVDCDIEEGLETVVVLQSFLAHELWRYIKDPKSAKELGWYPDEVIDAIRYAQPDTAIDPWDNPVAIQQRLKDCDLYVTARSNKIECARIYVREFDGKISEKIVQRAGAGWSIAPSTDTKWLYVRDRKYDNFSNAISAFFFEMEDGSWHGCSGLGKDIFAQMCTKDRLTCAGINSAMMRGALILQAKTPTAMKNAGLQMIGNSIIVPPDVNVQSSQVLGDIESVLAVNQFLETQVDSNTGVYRPRMEKPSGNPEPLGSTQLRFAQSNVLSSSAVDRFLKQEDHLYAEVIRRLFAPQHGNDAAAKAARECQERIMARGVPKEAMENIRWVRASRTLGNGSIVMRQNALASLAPFSARWPESGRQNFDEDVIEAFSDSTKVDRYLPMADKLQLPNDHMEMALLENGNLRTGSPVTWTPTQNNMIHAQTHLQAMGAAAASLQKGADPGTVYNFLEAAGPHTAIHLKQLAQDPTRKGAVKELGKQWQDLAGIADKIGAQLKKEAQSKGRARAIQGGMDPDTQLKAAETQAKLRNSEIKTKHQMGLREVQAKQKMAISAAEASQEMALKDASTASDIRRKRMAAFQSKGGSE